MQIKYIFQFLKQEIKDVSICKTINIATNNSTVNSRVKIVLFNNSEGPFSGGVCYQGSISCTHYGPVRGVHRLS